MGTAVLEAPSKGTVESGGVKESKGDEQARQDARFARDLASRLHGGLGKAFVEYMKQTSLAGSWEASIEKLKNDADTLLSVYHECVKVGGRYTFPKGVANDDIALPLTFLTKGCVSNTPTFNGTLIRIAKSRNAGTY